MRRDIIRDYTEGDTLPALARSHPTTGTDITGYTITFRMRRADGTLLTKVTPTDVSITDGPAGAYQINWAADDLIGSDVVQEAEVEFDDGAGGVQTDGPIWFEVREALG